MLYSRTNEHNGDSLSRCRKAACELASADFSTLIRRNCIDDKNALWHLPPTQSPPAKIQKTGLVHSGRCDHTCHDFLIPQRRRATKHNRLTHATKAQQMRFHFHWIHFFPSDVNHIRNSADDLKSILRFGRSEEHTSELQSLTNLVC